MQHATVDETFFATAPHRVTLSQEVPVDPATLFRCLENGPAWTEWLGLDDVTWTSPLGPGATRTVKQGPLTIKEEFFAWEPGEVMSFRFAESPLPLAAFAEEYRIVDLGGGRSRLDWTFAADGNGLMARAFVAGLKLKGKKDLPKLAELLRTQPARFGG